MALGGGIFTSQNKILPGTYINVISASNASVILSDRGVVAIAKALSWGAENTVIGIDASEVVGKSLEVFGYDYTADELKWLREIFRSATKLYVYRLGIGVKASCTYADARYSGVRGNDIKIIISENVDDSSKLDVKTFVGTFCVDEQTVSTSGKTDALKDNGFIVWKDGVDLAATAGISMTGGTDATVTGENHSAALAAFESVAFNTLVTDASEDTVKSVYTAYTKRMRDEIGIKFQLVVHNYAADNKGIVSVGNNVSPELVYWVAGAIAGCAINKSLTNKLYDGEYEVNTAYTQAALEAAIADGKFVLHRVGDEVRVLKDVNSLVTLSETEGEVFKDNQTIRVVDQIANDIATLFNTKYLGQIPNDEAGRLSLWTDIVKQHESLQTLRAIENFSDSDVSVVAGNSKQSVVVNDIITVIGSMTQLYMSCVVQ